MRVTLAHREEPLPFNGKNFFLDCTIDFSEEEKAIISERRLGDHIFQVEIARPPPSEITPPLMNIAGRWTLLGGVVLAAVGAGGIAALTFFGGAGMWGYSVYLRHQAEKENVTIGIRLRDLLEKPTFSTYVTSPTQGKNAELKIRSELEVLKSFLMGSAELGERQTFEL